MEWTLLQEKNIFLSCYLHALHIHTSMYNVQRTIVKWVDVQVAGSLTVSGSHPVQRHWGTLDGTVSCVPRPLSPCTSVSMTGVTGGLGPGRRCRSLVGYGLVVQPRPLHLQEKQWRVVLVTLGLCCVRVVTPPPQDQVLILECRRVTCIKINWKWFIKCALYMELLRRMQSVKGLSPAWGSSSFSKKWLSWVSYIVLCCIALGVSWSDYFSGTYIALQR